MSKRRWWNADERFKKVHQDLKLNYRQAVAQERARLEEEYKKKLTAMKDFYRIQMELEHEQAQKLISEITRVRLEFGPTEYGSGRFTLQVAMDERAIMGMNDLKTLGPFIIAQLAGRIQREFATIDFGRAKLVPPPSAALAKFPKWRIDSDDFVNDR